MLAADVVEGDVSVPEVSCTFGKVADPGGVEVEASPPPINSATKSRA